MKENKGIAGIIPPNLDKGNHKRCAHARMLNCSIKHWMKRICVTERKRGEVGASKAIFCHLDVVKYKCIQLFSMYVSLLVYVCV